MLDKSRFNESLYLLYLLDSEEKRLTSYFFESNSTVNAETVENPDFREIITLQKNSFDEARKIISKNCHKEGEVFLLQKDEYNIFVTIFNGCSDRVQLEIQRLKNETLKNIEEEKTKSLGSVLQLKKELIFNKDQIAIMHNVHEEKMKKLYSVNQNFLNKVYNENKIPYYSYYKHQSDILKNNIKLFLSLEAFPLALIFVIYGSAFYLSKYKEMQSKNEFDKIITEKGYSKELFNTQEETPTTAAEHFISLFMISILMQPIILLFTIPAVYIQHQQKKNKCYDLDVDVEEKYSSKLTI